MTQPVPKPPQYSLASLFRLTTKAAGAAALIALLPQALLLDIVRMLGMLGICFLLVAAEWLVVIAVWSTLVRAWRWGDRLIRRSCPKSS